MFSIADEGSTPNLSAIDLQRWDGSLYGNSPNQSAYVGAKGAFRVDIGRFTFRTSHGLWQLAGHTPEKPVNGVKQLGSTV